MANDPATEIRKLVEEARQALYEPIAAISNLFSQMNAEGKEQIVDAAAFIGQAQLELTRALDPLRLLGEKRALVDPLEVQRALEVLGPRKGFPQDLRSLFLPDPK